MSSTVQPRPAPRKLFQERQRITSLPLYFDGFLYVKRNKEQDFTNYWTELRGTTLFMYADNKQEMHTEMVDLMNLKSLADLFPSDKQLTKITLTLPNGEVQLKTSTPEDVEEWKGFILTVTQLSVPSRLALLPGQIIRLHEVLEKENLRRESQMNRPPAPSPVQEEVQPGENYIDVLQLPVCFYQVTRKEAADMLEQNPDCGNLILRPGGDSNNYAVSIRQLTDAPVVKHFRVVNTGKGYTIELEKPATLRSLDDVVEYFVNETGGKLVPYISSMYDTKLEVLHSEHDKNDVPKQNKPQARVSPLVSPAVKKPEKPVKPEKLKKTKIPIEEEDPDSTYMNDAIPAFRNLTLGWKVIDGNVTDNHNGDELREKLTKRKEKLKLDLSQRTAMTRKT